MEDMKIVKKNKDLTCVCGSVMIPSPQGPTSTTTDTLPVLYYWCSNNLCWNGITISCYPSIEYKEDY